MKEVIKSINLKRIIKVLLYILDIRMKKYSVSPQFLSLSVSDTTVLVLEVPVEFPAQRCAHGTKELSDQRLQLFVDVS